MEEENIENKGEQAPENEPPADPLDRVEKLIDEGDLYSAQHILSNIQEDSGRKHYLQSKIYKSECWYNEQRKQLKKAIKAEPDNEIYKKELDELMEFRKTAEYQNTVKRPKRAQLGKTDSLWAECCGEACCYCVCEGTCQAICDGLSGC